MWLSPRSLHNRVGYDLPQDNFHLMFPWFLQQITKCQDFSWCTWLSEDPKNWLCTCPYFFLLCEYYSYQMRGMETFFKIVFGGHNFFLCGHWYPCFGLLVTSPPGFKASVGSLIHAWQRHMCYMFSQIHLWCNTYWPLGSQPGVQAVLFHILVSQHWWGSKPGSIMPLLPDSVRPSRCSRLSYGLGNGNLQYTHMNCS